MKIVEKDDNAKVTLSEVEAGEVFEWQGIYFIKPEWDEHYKISVGLGGGIIKAIPPYVKVKPLKATLLLGSQT